MDCLTSLNVLHYSTLFVKRFLDVQVATNHNNLLIQLALDIPVLAGLDDAVEVFLAQVDAIPHSAKRTES